MNPPTQNEVVDLLTRVRAAQARLHELFTVLGNARDFTEQCRKQIAAIGTPAATDDDGWLRVASLEKKIERSNANVSEIEATVSKLCIELAQALDGGGRIVQRLLWAPYIENCNEIVSVLRPYCQSDDEARALAEQTAAARAWLQRCNSYAVLYKQLYECRDIEKVLGVLEMIEGPCAESFRGSPKLGRFLSATTASA